ncbi:predicted protein [Naegleria gruberi]|uniref:Predicted protein n=1 Tax=Naegleria gruberi TaxID=5762 RepID=D2VKY2_NAEGR|nr:uncharacterized protein NAEGRDRAFT_69592 [Naegleria gruberi]EFC42522.1 predicted protein [Naegleria gruberi]|eukprot:XP_002675266.1 predicted protein [Naegleria gruberi strain NEG-M]
MIAFCGGILEFEHEQVSVTEDEYFVSIAYQCRQLEHILEIESIYFDSINVDFAFIILYKIAKIIESTSHNILTVDWLFSVVFGAMKLALSYITRYSSTVVQALSYIKTSASSLSLNSLSERRTCSEMIKLLGEESSNHRNHVLAEALLSLVCSSLNTLATTTSPRDCKRIGALIVMRIVDHSFSEKNVLLGLVFDVFVKDFIKNGLIEFTYLSDDFKKLESSVNVQQVSKDIVTGSNIASQLKSVIDLSDNVSKMAVFSGVINAITVQRLDAPISHDGHNINILFDGLFPLLHYYCMQSKDSDLKLFSILSYSDSLLFLHDHVKARKSSEMEDIERFNFENRVSKLIKGGIQIVFSNIENQVYDIFAKMRQLFMDLLDLRDFLTLDKVKSQIDLVSMTNSILDSDWTRKGKYISLIALLPRITASKIYSLCPEIFTNILSSLGHLNGSVNGNASLFFEKMLSDLLKDCKKNKEKIAEWEIMCLKPVSDFLAMCDKKQRSAIFIHLMSKILKVNNEGTAFLVKCFKAGIERTESSTERSALLHSLMFTLKTAKSLSLYELDFKNDLELIEEGLIHNDHDIRLDAFELITVSTKKLALPTEQELAIIIKFARLNLRGCKSSFRFGFGDAIERFIKRVNEICVRIFASHQKNQTLNHLLDVSTPEGNMPQKKREELNKDRHSYRILMEFLYDYATEVINSLYPGCPHERLLVALDCYKSLLDTFSLNNSIDVFNPSDTNRVVSWKRIHLTSSNSVLTLLNTLGSCWDKVRVVIYDLLASFMAPLTGFETPEKVKVIANNAFDLIKSPRLRESDAGALLYRIIFKKYVCELGWEVFLDKEPVTSCSVSPQLSFCKKLVALLKEKTENCAQNIFNITKDSALVGILQTLIYVISDVDFTKERTTISEWREWMTEFLGILEKACLLSVKIIAGAPLLDENEDNSVAMNNVDCRGHIFFGEDEEVSGDTHSLTVNSWLAVKSSSMLISVIVHHVELYPDSHSNDKLSKDSIITFDQIEKLGKMLLNILLTTKHNGAIEKSAVGFNILCKRLMSCGIPELVNIPEKWTRYLLDGIGKDDTFSMMRRSAGLPWTFASIMKSEPTFLPRKLLPETMQYLLNVALNQSNYKTSQVVNALNVLRFLFHDAQLGPYVQQFVEDGLIISLKGFGSTIWAIKNSSLMMYTALLHRSLGDNDSIKTGTEYFSRYPRLRTFLLEQLNTVTDENREHKRILHPSLYPMLLLLSRLRPSLDESTETEANSVSQFIPFVKKCSAMIHHMARSIGARALEPLIPSSMVKEYILDTINALPKTVEETIHQNELHGVLFQLNRFVTTSFKAMENSEQFALDCLNKLANSFIGTIQNRCFATRSLFYEIINNLLQMCKNIPQETLETLWNNSVNSVFLESTSTNGQPAKQEMFFNNSTFIVELYLLFRKDVDEDLVVNLLNFSAMDVRRATFKYLYKEEHVVQALSGVNAHAKIENLRPLILEHALFRETDVECARFGLASLVNLYNKAPAGQLTKDLSVMSSYLDNVFDAVPTRLVYLYVNETNTVLHQLVIALLGIFISGTIESQPENPLVKKWLKIVCHASDPARQSHVRAACLDSIVSSGILTISANDLKSAGNQFSVWTALITLLQDEDDIIRSRAALIVSPLIFGFEHKGTTSKQAKCAELQREYVLERSFAFISHHYGKLTECHNYLVSCIQLEEAINEENNSVEVVLPFKTTDEEVMLFEKEEDNVFTEELAISQLGSYYLNKLDISSEFRQQVLQKLEGQLLFVLKILSERRKQQIGLFWVGNFSFQPTVFIIIAKLVLAINTLGYFDIEKLRPFFENQEINEIHRILSDSHYRQFLVGCTLE